MCNISAAMPQIMGLLALVVLPLLATGARAAATGENLALGKPYVLHQAVNYRPDEDDLTNLTDGEYSAPLPELFWELPSTVGWRLYPHVAITIDLGQVEPIAGVSFSTAANSGAGAEWPNAVFVAVSDDQNTWRLAGELIGLALHEGRVPEEARGQRFRYVTDRLQARGRWVRFVVVPAGFGYVFCDELEVYRGPDSLLDQEPAGRIVPEYSDTRGSEEEAAWSHLADSTAFQNCIRRRLYADIAQVREKLAACPLPGARKQALADRLDAVARETIDLPEVDPATFKTIYPVNSLHARILAVHGAVLRARGFPPLSASKVHRYDNLQPFDELPEQTASVSLAMMHNEFRAEAIALTNAAEKPRTVGILVQGLPGGPCPEWLSVSAIPWTDTSIGVPIASALPWAARRDQAFQVTLPAGVVSKLWL